MSSKGNSSSSKICSFCNLDEDNELEYGKIYEHNGIFTHYYCLLLSSNMEQRGNDDEGILGFLTEDIQKELRRGKRLACSYCRKNGATLGCCNVKCKRIFHFPCGLKAGSLHQFFGEFRSFCINHRPKQKIDSQILNQISSVNNVVCYICYDKVDTNDFVKTLWAPCCKKDAWFHRLCVQQLALSAGYFFKCPLCNNKKDFQKAMLEYGIYVPSQDASWELVPNAFEELLYRHDQCDAVKCLCPKGRKHTSNNAKWELALCRTCGSQGIHMACGQLKWANPIWECDECTSILRNLNNDEHERLGNSSTIGSSNENKESNSDLESDSDSDLDSDTDISVGTDFPIPFSIANSSSTSSLDSIVDVKLRPGPRSFKLQQQRMKLGKCNLDLTNTDLEKNATTEASLKDSNKSLKNDEKEEEPSTSKENIPQQENKEDSTREEKQSSSKNDEKSQPIQKEILSDIITIESDDDDDVKLIALTHLPPPLTQRPIQLNSSRVPSISVPKKVTPLNATDKSAASTSQSIVTIDLSKNDYINVLTASDAEISNENKPIITEHIGEAIPQGPTVDLTSNTLASSSNDLEETYAVDTIDTSIMNIKITNVTSLPPEVFENVPDVCDDVTSRTNVTDTSSLSAITTLEQSAAHVSSMKRSIYEAGDVTDGRKKTKRNTSSPINVIIAHDTNETQNDARNNTNRQQSISTSNSSKIEKNNSSKCTSTSTTSSSTNSYNPLLTNNQKNNLPTQFIPLHELGNLRHVYETFLERNISVNKHQGIEKPAAQIQPTELVTLTKNSQVFLQIPPNSNCYLQQIPNPDLTVSQNAKRINETTVYAIPSNNVVLPCVTDDVFSKQPLLVNQSIMTKATVPILYDNQTTAANQQEAKSTISIPVTRPSVGNTSLNKSYCDGDAGTRPVEADTVSTTRKKAGPSDLRKSAATKQSICQNLVTTRSIFPQVTNNHNTCHQPRLIPRYVDLHDLKFQVCASNNIQMTLYDTFSVNISMKNSKKSKSRLIGATASRDPREPFTLASRETSCSSDYIENISTEGQRSDKLFCSSKSEHCSISDKSACARRIAHGQDDAKENLDPITSRILSHSDTLVNPTNNIDDAETMNDCFCGESGSETRLVPSDTNLSVLNRTISSTRSIDNVTDGATLVSNNCNQDLRVNVEDVQQQKQMSIRVPSAEERPGARLFLNETNRVAHSVDFDLNVVNMYKNVEKVLQDDIASINQRADGYRICNDTDDSPTLQNGYKNLDSTNVIRSRVNDRHVPRVSNVTKFNEHSILNKQIDASDSKEFIQCVTYGVQKNVTSMSQRADGCRIGSNRTDDSSTLQNGCKHLDSTNVTRSKINNRSVPRVSNITRLNEHGISNKQTDPCESKKFGQCIRHNNETRTKSSNDKFCLKVSVDLCRIQSLIDSKPELFKTRKFDTNDQRLTRTSRIPGLDARQQIRYCDIDSDGVSNCLSKNKELQKLYHPCNNGRVPRDVFSDSNTYRHQNQEVHYFDKEYKDILDR